MVGAADVHEGAEELQKETQLTELDRRSVVEITVELELTGFNH